MTNAKSQGWARFSVREALAVVLIVSLLLAWHGSWRRTNDKAAQLALQLRYAELELERSTSIAQSRETFTRRGTRSPDRALWLATLDGNIEGRRVDG